MFQDASRMVLGFPQKLGDTCPAAFGENTLCEANELFEQFGTYCLCFFFGKRFLLKPFYSPLCSSFNFKSVHAPLPPPPPPPPAPLTPSLLLIPTAFPPRPFHAPPHPFRLIPLFPIPPPTLTPSLCRFEGLKVYTLERCEQHTKLPYFQIVKIQHFFRIFISFFQVWTGESSILVIAFQTLTVWMFESREVWKIVSLVASGSRVHFQPRERSTPLGEFSPSRINRNHLRAHSYENEIRLVWPCEYLLYTKTCCTDPHS